ncbi:hypothetical protein niasHT_026574 [Heterodera trifolii]|uniref:Uncharacterized protein n=1 Tax=Heterodera trifolii TaxID=157864 RepID=A0ABD2KSL0_9BILA
MRLDFNKSDIAWFLGSVIHLLAFQTYPLEEWHIRNKTLADQCQLDGTFKMPQNHFVCFCSKTASTKCYFLLKSSKFALIFLVVSRKSTPFLAK